MSDEASRWAIEMEHRLFGGIAQANDSILQVRIDVMARLDRLQNAVVLIYDNIARKPIIEETSQWNNINERINKLQETLDLIRKEFASARVVIRTREELQAVDDVVTMMHREIICLRIDSQKLKGEW